MTVAFLTHLAVISWTLFSAALLLVILRITSQVLLHRPSPTFLRALAKFQADDYMMSLTVLALLGVVVSANQVATHGSNYISDAENVADWTDDRKQRAIWGSKMSVALEEFMLATLWLVKACLLVLYGRMTTGLKKQTIAVKAIGIYCVVGFIIVQGLYLGCWCKPISNYWALPVPADQEQCKTYKKHMLVTSAFHLSSDVAMFLIPLPIIVAARLPLRRRMVLCAVFSLGFLDFVLGILNRHYNWAAPDDFIFLVWYCAEASTAVMVANMPFCWTLLQRVFKLGSWGSPSPAAGNQPRRRSLAIAMDAMRRRREAWDRVEDSDEEE